MIPANSNHPYSSFSEANYLIIMIILLPFSVKRMLWGMHSSISSFTTIPNTKDKELATSEASRFSPMGLNTNAWLIGLSIY